MNKKIRYQIAIFIAVRVVLNTALRMVYPFLPVFGRSLDVSLSTISKAVALRSASGILGPFLASIGDLRGRKIGMLLGLIFFIAANGLVVFIPTFPVFVLSMVLSLLGYFTFNPTMQAYLGDRVDYKNRGRALALPELGWSLSFILGVPVIGFLIARFSWQSPFFVLTGLGILVFLVLAAVLPPDPVRKSGQPGMWQTFGIVLTSLPVLAGMLLGAASSMSNELVSLIFGVWLEDTFAVKITTLGFTAAIIGFAELSGELSSAGLVDRIGKTRAVAAGLIVNSLVGLSLAFIGVNLISAFVALFLFYLSFEFTVVCSIPIITEILPRARATVMAVIVAVISLGRAVGDIISPWLYRLGQSQSFFPGLIFIGIGVVLLNLTALFALRFLSRSIQNIESNPVIGI